MQTKWFRPESGRVFHLAIGYERTSIGLSITKTACGKKFFEGEKYLRGDKKHCANCEAAEHRLHSDAGESADLQEVSSTSTESTSQAVA